MELPRKNIGQTADGFVMDLPKYAPGERNGRASLSFGGFENFAGTVSEEAGRVRLKVDHALPLLRRSYVGDGPLIVRGHDTVTLWCGHGALCRVPDDRSIKDAQTRSR